MINNRLNWNDKDWAAYLGCPVEHIQKYRTKLEKDFISRVDIKESDGKYHFCLYTYRLNESGNKMLQPIFSSNIGSFSEQNAVDEANEKIIPILLLPELYAKKYNIPEKAIQMLLIKDNIKGR